MKSSIINFLITNNIDFNISGKNVSRGCVAIKCPLCGESDKSTHCNINLKTGRFFCWRDKTHKGSFAYLNKLLTGGKWGISNYVDDEEFKNLFQKSKEESPGTDKELSLSFAKSLTDFPSNSIFHTYLMDRGFPISDDFISRYSVHACNYGKWGWRIIFPIYINTRLASWVGRSVAGSSLPYLELSKDESLIPPKECLFNFDNLFFGGGDLLVICEGIFDALKMDYFSSHGVGATCLFTKRIKSNKQTLLLGKLLERFNKVLVLLDFDAIGESIELSQELMVFNKKVDIGSLPVGAKDPGELKPEQVREVTCV